MAISSIHIEAGASGYIAHNDRSKKTENSIFKENENEIWNMKKEAFELFKSELKIRSAAYTKRTGQKLQKKAHTHLSSIINLNENHTMKDIKKVADYLESEFGTKVFQIAIHRDEGHISDENEKVVNYHAHIEFLGLDQEGKSIKRKFNRSTLIKLQTKVAELLEMERGQNYSKTQSKRPKRLDTYEFKFHKEQEQKVKNQTLAKQKDLKAENAKLQAQLRELGAKQPDHAKREQLVRELKEQIKQKNLTIEELKERLAKNLSDFKSKDEPFIAQRYKDSPEGKLELVTDELSSLPTHADFKEISHEVKITLSQSVDYLLEKNTKTVEVKKFLSTETKEELNLQQFISDLKQIEQEHQQNYNKLVKLFASFSEFATKTKNIIEEGKKKYKQLFEKKEIKEAKEKAPAKEAKEKLENFRARRQ